MDDQKEDTYSKKIWSAIKGTAFAFLSISVIAAGTLIYQQQQTITDMSFRISVLERRTDTVEMSTRKTESRLDSAIRSTNRNFRTVQKTEDNLEIVVGALIEMFQKAPDPSSSNPSSYWRNGL